MANRFHLAIPVGDITEAMNFYCNVLGCEKGNSEFKYPDAWVDINFWDLILGTTIPFRTLSGKEINITVPKKTSPTASLKLAKQGLRNDRHQGDCYVKINAVMPKNVDDETIQFLMILIKKNRKNIENQF